METVDDSGPTFVDFDTLRSENIRLERERWQFKSDAQFWHEQFEAISKRFADYVQQLPAKDMLDIAERAQQLEAENQTLTAQLKDLIGTAQYYKEQAEQQQPDRSIEVAQLEITVKTLARLLTDYE